MQVIETSNNPNTTKKRKFDRPSAPEPDLNAKSEAQKQNIQPLDLPSKYTFYGDLTNVTMRNFKWREYGLIAAAQEAQSFRSVAEAVSNTILNYDGMNLTYGDWMYCMYMHRVRMRRPFKVLWTCQAEKHIDWVVQKLRPNPKFRTKEPESDDNPKLIPCNADSLKNELEVTRSNLKQIFPNVDKISNIIGDGGEIAPGMFVYPVRVEDKVQESDEMDMLNEEAAENETLTMTQLQKMLATRRHDNVYAMLLNPLRHGKTLAERRKFLEDYFKQYDGDDFDVLQKLNEFAVASHHGVEETVNAKCGVCGSEAVIDIRFAPTEFFPVVSGE